MRATFIRTLGDLAERDERILFLTGDLGFSVVEPLAARIGRRFINVGVAEQNMVGLATGLAEAGFIPFVYSIATFASLRPYEFIRNGPLLHNLPVRIIGVGGGFEYGTAGSTHHALEDLGVMRLQPGLRVIAPADFQQTAAALNATWDLPGPTYFRIGKDEQTVVPGLDGRFELGRIQRVHPGHEVLLIAVGSIAAEVVAAAAEVTAHGIACGALIVDCLNPAPIDDLVAELAGCRLAVTVEAHYVTGGLGSLVSEIVAEHGIGCRVLRRGISRVPDGVSGSERYLLDRHGLSRAAIVQATLGSRELIIG
jgi:transketolase